MGDVFCEIRGAERIHEGSCHRLRHCRRHSFIRYHHHGQERQRGHGIRRPRGEPDVSRRAGGTPRAGRFLYAGGLCRQHGRRRRAAHNRRLGQRGKTAGVPGAHEAALRAGKIRLRGQRRPDLHLPGHADGYPALQIRLQPYRGTGSLPEKRGRRKKSRHRHAGGPSVAGRENAGRLLHGD